MSFIDLRPLRLLACALGLALPLLLGSCSSSSSKVKGVPKNLPVIDLHGSSSTPSHSMPRSEYPFDSGGGYVTAWAAEGETKAGRSAATSSDYSGWKSSHHEGELSKPKKVSAGSSTKSKSKSTASKSKKPSGSRRHMVKKGDTLSTIARKYGTSVSKLKSANGLKSDMIRDGRSLTIPR